MEGFMRKIYNFINGLEILHLIGKLIFVYVLYGGYSSYNVRMK